MSAPRIAYTLEEASEQVGVSQDTLRAAVREGALRAKRTGKAGGGRYLFTHSALVAWLDGLVDA